MLKNQKMTKNHEKLPSMQRDNNLDFLSLKGGCTGSSESTLVKIPHCWKSCYMKIFLYLQDLQAAFEEALERYQTLPG